MASDYDRIREENIRGYGEYKHHLAFLGRLYTDRTHFLFELLQNAEDAGATIVRFSLRLDRLEFRHNGRPFDEGDVRGVCGVEEGTKTKDLTKIGKFGIGFKSVYAYSARPEIHSGDEHFRIEDFVRPYPTDGRELDDPWTTLFVFPFDRDEVNPVLARSEIGKRLRNLSARTLLFLRNIVVILWDIDDKSRGQHRRSDQSMDHGRWISIEVQANGRVVRREGWLVFERLVAVPKSDIAVPVEIAFQITDDKKSAKKMIEPVQAAELVAYFPTEKPTGLGFLIQGAYRTTPARDNVPKDEPWNALLVRETASLVVDSLPKLRNMGLVSVGLLEALPTRLRGFSADDMFFPIYEAVRSALRDEPLLPTQNGGYVAAKNAKLARSAGLIDLFDSAQLRDLFGRDESLHWLSTEISEVRTPDLRRYLLDNRAFWYEGILPTSELVDEIEVRPETVARNLTLAFMSKQEDTWVGRLYSFLDGIRETRSILRDKRFIRLENRTHVPPFNPDGTPRAYLPTAQETDFPTVRRAVVANEQARQFLRNLGLTEPDVVAEVVGTILPKYQISGTAADLDWDHDHDMQFIVSALQTDSLARKGRLVVQLRATPFVRAINAGSGHAIFLQPERVYLRSEDLALYFGGNHDAWLMDEPLLPAENAKEIGIKSIVRNDRRAPDQVGGHVTIVVGRGEHVRGLNGFDPEFQLDGLEHALKTITPNKARFIWNELLVLHRRALRGIVESASRQTFEQATQTTIYSKAGDLAIRHAWLPSRRGGMHRPSDLSLDDLPEDFKRDDRLGKLLGMKAAIIDEFAKRYELEPETLRFVLEHPTELKEWCRAQLEQREAEQHTSDYSLNGAMLDFGDALTTAFAKPGVDVDANIQAGRGLVRNPPLRRERIQEEILNARESEPTQAQRFRKVPTRAWEAKDNSVRIFLAEEYGGRCQICEDVFYRRDGQPYFEGLYLASRTLARWIDRPGNVLCLCATCCAKFLYGTIEVDQEIVAQIGMFRAHHEGGIIGPGLNVRLCGESTRIRFSERHMMDLQEMLRSSAQ